MKNSLILYHAYSEHFELLTDEELGQLLRAIMLYDEQGIVTELEGMVKMAFSFIKKDLDISREKYAAKCEKNRENGEKGGRGNKKEIEEQSERKNKESEKSERFSEKPKKADNDNENDNEHDNENDNDNVKRKRFKAPALSEVQAYCAERKNNVDPERFMAYYTFNGWKVGKNPMKDWKAAVRSWEKNELDIGGSAGQRAAPVKPSRHDFEELQRKAFMNLNSGGMKGD